MLGLSEDTVLSGLDDWIGRIHPDDAPRFTDALKRHTSGEIPQFQCEVRMLHQDGTYRWMLARGLAVRDEHGEISRCAGSLTDTTERKLAEEQLRKISRARKVIIECNEALIRARDEAQLLASICKIVTSTGGYPLAWIGFAEQDERSTVRPVASAGDDEDYVRSSDITWGDTDRGRGPPGQPSGPGCRQLRGTSCTTRRTRPGARRLRGAATRLL
jgi:PAS domain S-box-containing protein